MRRQKRGIAMVQCIWLLLGMMSAGLTLAQAADAAPSAVPVNATSSLPGSAAAPLRRALHLKQSAARSMLQINRTNEQFVQSNTSVPILSSPPVTAVKPGAVSFDLPPDQPPATTANTTTTQVKTKKRFPLVLILAIVIPVTVVLFAGIALLCVRNQCCGCGDKVDPEDLVPPPPKKADPNPNPQGGVYAVDLKALMQQREDDPGMAVAEVHTKSPPRDYSRVSSMKDTPISKREPSFHSTSSETPIPARTSYFATAPSHASLNSHRSSMDGTNGYSDLHSAPPQSYHGYETMSVRSSTAPSLQSQDEEDMSAARRRESLRAAFEMALKPLDDVALGTRKMAQKASSPGLPKPGANKPSSPQKSSPVKTKKSMKSAVAAAAAAGPSSSSGSGSSGDTTDSGHSSASRKNRRAGKEPRHISSEREKPMDVSNEDETPELTINPTLLDSNLSQQRTSSNVSTLSIQSSGRRDPLNAFGVSTTSSNRLDAERTQSPTNLDVSREFLTQKEGIIEPSSPSAASDSSFDSEVQKPPGLIEPSSPQGETSSDSTFSPRSECNTGREVPLDPVQGTEPCMIAVPELPEDTESEREEDEEEQKYDDLSQPTKVSDVEVRHVEGIAAVMNHTGGGWSDAGSSAMSMRMSAERLPERTHREGRRDNIRQSWPQEGPSTPVVPGQRAAALAGHGWETRKSRSNRSRAVFATSDNDSLLSERDSVRSSTEQWLNRNDSTSLPSQKELDIIDARTAQANMTKVTEEDDPDTSTDNFTMNFSDDDDDMEVDVAALTVRPLTAEEVQGGRWRDRH